MKTLRKIALFIPLIFLASCTGPKESYAGKITPDSTRLVVNVTQTEYKHGDRLDTNTIHVTFDGKEISYEGESPNPKEGSWFVTKSNTTPTASRVKSESLDLQTSENRKEETFYVALIVEDNVSLHVSKPITIVIINAQAMKKWVYWVVGSIVLFGCVALVYFSRKYKHDHPNK